MQIDVILSLIDYKREKREKNKKNLIKIKLYGV